MKIQQVWIKVNMSLKLKDFDFVKFPSGPYHGHRK